MIIYNRIYRVPNLLNEPHTLRGYGYNYFNDFWGFLAKMYPWLSKSYSSEATWWVTNMEQSKLYFGVVIRKLQLQPEHEW